MFFVAYPSVFKGNRSLGGVFQEKRGRAEREAGWSVNLTRTRKLVVIQLATFRVRTDSTLESVLFLLSLRSAGGEDRRERTSAILDNFSRQIQWTNQLFFVFLRYDIFKIYLFSSGVPGEKVITAIFLTVRNTTKRMRINFVENNI